MRHIHEASHECGVGKDRNQTLYAAEAARGETDQSPIFRLLYDGLVGQA